MAHPLWLWMNKTIIISVIVAKNKNVSTTFTASFMIRSTHVEHGKRLFPDRFSLDFRRTVNQSGWSAWWRHRKVSEYGKDREIVRERKKLANVGDEMKRGGTRERLETRGVCDMLVSHRWRVVRVVVCSVVSVVDHLLVDPHPEMWHVHVHARSFLAAADSPRDNARLMELFGMLRGRAHQRTSAIALCTRNFKNYKHPFPRQLLIYASTMRVIRQHLGIP